MNPIAAARRREEGSGHHDAQTGNSYFRMYEFKSTVYCSHNTNDTTAIPQLTKVDTASFDIALQTYVDSAEETARRAARVS